MPVSTAHGLTYPAESDSGDVAYWISQLAASMETSQLAPIGKRVTSAGGSASTVALAATGTNYVPVSSTTTLVTLTAATYLRVVCRARFGQRTAAAGNYLLVPSYNPGVYDATGLSLATIGNGAQGGGNGNGSTFDEDITVEECIAFAPGTYTFYPAARRSASTGAATDVVYFGTTYVFNAGPQS